MNDNVQIAYAAAYERVQAAIMKLNEAIHDMPAPGSDDGNLDWGHVGTMNKIAADIEDAAQ
jgi:hypothetical protein